MRTRKSARATTLLTAVMLAIGIAAQPAFAAVPPNDDIENATVITALPYTEELNISDATKSQTDPRPSCDPGTRGNVWWTITPNASGWLAADTLGSGIPTVAAVYTGTPGALTEVACNDDTRRNDMYSEQARVYWNATAGTQYYLMVAKDYGGGGKLNLTVATSEAPFTVDEFAIDSTGSVDNQTGIATLSGTVTCSQGPEPVYIQAELVQQIGRFYIRDYSRTKILCDGTVPWRLKFRSDDGLFTGGQVEVRSAVYWGAGNGGYLENAVTTIHLRG